MRWVKRNRAPPVQSLCRALCGCGRRLAGVVLPMWGTSSTVAQAVFHMDHGPSGSCCSNSLRTSATPLLYRTRFFSELKRVKTKISHGARARNLARGSTSTVPLHHLECDHFTFASHPRPGSRSMKRTHARAGCSGDRAPGLRAREEP